MLIQKIILRLRRVFMCLKSYVLLKFGTRIASTHTYADYNDYENHQKEKTTDPERVKKWLNEEWDIKINGFKEVFQRNWKYLEGKQKAICMGARTGQEVKALLDMGINAIGIDLVPFLPYTVEGDIHALNYNDNEFDFVFTNIFDHSLHPDVFCSEMERVCKSEGIIIIHLQLGLEDEYTEVVVYNPKKVIELFDSVVVKESRRIRNTFDVMSWELILEKV